MVHFPVLLVFVTVKNLAGNENCKYNWQGAKTLFEDKILLPEFRRNTELLGMVTFCYLYKSEILGFFWCIFCIMKTLDHMISALGGSNPFLRGGDHDYAQM